jgi:hypothetical protein
MRRATLALALVVAGAVILASLARAANVYYTTPAAVAATLEKGGLKATAGKSGTSTHVISGSCRGTGKVILHRYARFVCKILTPDGGLSIVVTTFKNHGSAWFYQWVSK